MKNIHVTKDGDKLLISSMDDAHLINTVNVHLNRMESCISIINTGIKNSLDSIISGLDADEVKERATDGIVMTYETLCPYVIELTIRGIDMSQEFQRVFGRSGKTGNLSYTDVYEVKNLPF